MRIWWMAAVALVATPAVAKPAVQADRDIAAAKAAVADDMLDPGAAQFRKLRKIKTTGSAQVCGEVNGKNSYGAYTGFKPFIYSVRSGSHMIKPSDAEWEDLEPATRLKIFEAFSDC